MKAIQYTAFGGSDVIKLVETEKPVPKDDEVLIKVAAVTVNPADMKFRTGILQERMPIVLPFIPGLDVAGTVEAIGTKVSRIKAGDKVFGGKFGGTYAQYTVLKEESVSIAPSNTSINEAAALVVSLVTAYSFLIEHAAVKQGQRLLIQGIAGGTGAVILQMAKALGLYVIGTASAKGMELAKSLGADELINYKTQDFTSLVKDVDLVIDMVGGETQAKSFKVLKKGGKLFSAVMPPSQELAKQYEVEAKFISSAYSYKKLDYGRQLVEQGKIKPRIAKTMKLDDAAKAQDMVSAGGIDGKLVLEID
jgi:NADPH:quinone reductase-like Zn-dependent oxidoreductase